MRFITTCALFLVVVCVTFGETATIDTNALSLNLETEGTDIFANTNKLIEELVSNLRLAAQKAADAMSTFAAGLKDQVMVCKKKFEAEIQTLSDRVSQAISSLGDRFTNAGSAVSECIQSNNRKAQALYNEAMYNTMACADEKVQEVGNLISRQVEISQGGMEFADYAMEEMKNCSGNKNLITKGACLGRVTLKTEMQGAVFLTRSGISIARIEIALASLPVSLEMCAGRRLIDAGLGTAKIIMDLSQCSASSAFSTVTGSNNVPIGTFPAGLNVVSDAINVAEVNQPAAANLPAFINKPNQL